MPFRPRGNTIRNVTADHFAGAAADEVVDPRPYAELLRQWSTDHPEFQFMPRKFKIAVTGSARDRAVIKAHDIGLRLLEREGRLGFEVIVGGGPGADADDWQDAERLCARSGYSALSGGGRVGLEPGSDAGTTSTRPGSRSPCTNMALTRSGSRSLRAMPLCARHFDDTALKALDRIKTYFKSPDFFEKSEAPFKDAYHTDPAFRAWVDTNTEAHKQTGHAIVTISLKAHGATPGDASAEQMRVMAGLAKSYSHDELRISHEQNVILPHVHRADLPAIHAEPARAWPCNSQCRPDLRHHRLPRYGLLRARHRALHPHRAGHR